jgi:hypothetical protein
VSSVYQAGKLLGAGGARPDCAIAAWQAVLDHDTSTGGSDFSSLLGLQSQLVATGRLEELTELLDSAAATGSGGLMSTVKQRR